MSGLLSYSVSADPVNDRHALIVTRRTFRLLSETSLAILTAVALDTTYTRPRRVRSQLSGDRRGIRRVHAQDEFTGKPRRHVSRERGTAILCA